MLLSIVGLLAATIVALLAAHAARERRALAEDVRALRGELRGLARAMGGASGTRDVPPSRPRDADASLDDAARRGPGAGQQRSRTLH